MGNKVKIEVKILHYVNGQNIRAIGDVESYLDSGDIESFLDIDPLFINKELLSGQILSLSAINDYCSAIDNYCRKVAGKMIPYDTECEGYLLLFYYDDELISSALLNNYSDFFGHDLDLDDLEITE
ncbi:MAG TPA: hypothetical protein VIL26_06340 [Clostridia bacterium]